MMMNGDENMSVGSLKAQNPFIILLLKWIFWLTVGHAFPFLCISAYSGWIYFDNIWYCESFL